MFRQTPGDELTMKVEDLVEREEYQFRVKAVNKAGPSEPSESTDWHMAKHRKREDHHTYTDIELLHYLQSMSCTLLGNTSWHSSVVELCMISAVCHL